MNTLEIKDFTAGWIPSDDPISGRKNGLVRMDNAILDEYGALTITKAFNKVHTTEFSGSVHSIYSRQLSGTKCRYVGLSDGKVQRDKGDDFATIILSGAGPAAMIRTAFGAGYNFVYIASGTQKKKDTGTTVYKLGVKVPGGPVTAVGATSPQITLTDSYDVTLNEGSNQTHGSTYFTADTDTTTFRVDAYHTFSSPRNMMDFGSSKYGSDDDKMSFGVRIPDFDKLDRVQIQFYFGTVDGSPDTSPDLTNYYAYEWLPDVTKQFIREGKDQWSTLSALRSQFSREGTDNTKNWSNINGIRVVFKYTEAVVNCAFANVFYNGSDHGPLTGTYEYLQINVGNNGSYFAKSPAGPAINFPLELNNSYATITPDDPAGLSDAQINEVWIFRRKSNAVGSDPLGQFYRVKQIKSSLGAAFDDIVSDTLALEINIKLNQFALSLQDSTFPNDVYYMEVNYFERTWYMTPREIWLSEPLNPDAVDTRYTVKLSGDSFETNLWMIKSGPSTILVGTTHDIYELSGTAKSLPDGTLDLTIRSLGIKQPPIDDSVCIYNGSLFYLANDGIRVLNGSGTESFNGALDLLFKGYTRFGQLPVYNASINNSTFSFTAANNKLYVGVTVSDTSRNVFVYDFIRKYWYVYFTDPASLFTEEDGTLLAGYADASDFFLRQLEVGTKIDNDHGQNILIRFPINFDLLPFNRKDSYTLKLKINTGGVNVTAKIYKDESSSGTTISSTVNSNGIGELSYDISSSIGIAKSYQLELSCAIIEIFRLTEWAIEYDARPKQTKYLRIPPDNYGIAGRKRFPTLPLLIDTLGGNVTFTPYIDNTAQTTSTINTADKEVFSHLFTTDKKGYVIGGTLQGSAYFEFYSLIVPRVVELLPDPTRFFAIPFTNLGFQGRKRFIAFAFVIDTGGSDVTFTPYVDNAAGTPSTVNTNGKLTYIHYFTSDTPGTDIGGTLSGSAQFEYYGLNLEECISEKMPSPAKFLLIPEDDYGTPNRKRFSSFKFLINSKGANVTFTPRIDGVDSTPSTVNTSEKDIHEHFFSVDTIGKAIGGKLSGSSAFEFYGPLKEQDIEVLPPRLKFFVVPENNFGVAAKKRIRTLPLVINTNGSDVVYTPIVDNSARTTATFNTPNKQTVFYYFEEDSFGVDYKGTLLGTSPFEFYGMGKPEQVEVIPVGKKWDQLGPIEFPRLGKVIMFRIKLIPEGTSITYKMYADDVQIGATGTITCVANKDQVVEVKLPKGINATVFRVELMSSSPFHRYYGRFKVNTSGMDSEPKWILFGADPDAKPN